MENHVTIAMSVIIPSNVAKMMPSPDVSILKAVTDVYVTLVSSSTQTCNVRILTSVIRQILSVETEIAKISADHSNVTVIPDSSSVLTIATVSMSTSVWTVIHAALASASTLMADTVVSALLDTKKKTEPVLTMTSVMMLKIKSTRMVSVTTIPKEASRVLVLMATRKHTMVLIALTREKVPVTSDQTIVAK